MAKMPQVMQVTYEARELIKVVYEWRTGREKGWGTRKVCYSRSPGAEWSMSALTGCSHECAMAAIGHSSDLDDWLERC